MSGDDNKRADTSETTGSGGLSPVSDGRGNRSAMRHSGAADDRPHFGEAWVYESIVSALPGASLSPRAAIALQLGVFEVGMLVLAAAYDLWTAAIAGTVAVGVAAAGSYFMLQLGRANRTLAVPDHYYRLLFGSSIEVVLAVLAFTALITHLFVFDPTTAGDSLLVAELFPVGQSDQTLLTALFGPEPPVPAVYLMLLVLWDLCYRIGTSWWAAVVSLYRELRVPLPSTSAVAFRRLDLLNVGFALTQLALLPFIRDRPVLLLAVAGHVLAVTAVSGAAVVLSTRRRSLE